jgi:carbon-monoxide dehydrogenase medium subunit
VVGAVTEIPTRLTAAEAVLNSGGELNSALIERACEAAAAEVPLLSDTRGSAAYKKQLVRIYVGRALRTACKQEGTR